MIILIGILPAYFALNPHYGVKDAQDVAHSLEQMARAIEYRQSGMFSQVGAQDSGVRFQLVSCPSDSVDPISWELQEMANFLGKHDCMERVTPEERSQLRRKILLLEDHIKNLERSGTWDLASVDKSIIRKVRGQLRSMTDYAPTWVILMVAASIGLGTMVGWKRVVITVGEKIGRRPLNYAQGASSQMVAMVTIGLADVLGLPVSTTHVLSSGVTGTMVANGVGLEYGTLRNIALAWILTLPVTIFLGGTLFLLFHWLAKV